MHSRDRHVGHVPQWLLAGPRSAGAPCLCGHGRRFVPRHLARSRLDRNLLSAISAYARLGPCRWDIIFSSMLFSKSSLLILDRWEWVYGMWSRTSSLLFLLLFCTGPWVVKPVFLNVHAVNVLSKGRNFNQHTVQTSLKRATLTNEIEKIQGVFTWTIGSIEDRIVPRGPPTPSPSSLESNNLTRLINPGNGSWETYPIIDVWWDLLRPRNIRCRPIWSLLYT